MGKNGAGLLFIVLCLGFTRLSHAAATEPARQPVLQRQSLTLQEIGLLDVTSAPYKADPSGKIDSTQAIQQAVKDAYQKELVCFFPVGTYLVSDTIYAPQEMSTHSQANCLIGSTAGPERPRLILCPNANGFADRNKPKPVVWIWTKPNAHKAEKSGGKIEIGSNDPEHGNPNMGFCQIFRGIDIEVGEGNEGAVGLNFGGAQHCEIADSTVTLRSGFAGFYNLIGVNGMVANLKVIGGSYGLYCPQSKWPTIIGSEFIDQTEAAIGPQFSMLTLVGCRIAKEQSPAIAASETPAYAGGCVNLIDSIIEIEEATDKPVIDNVKAKTIVMNNVFVRNARNLIQTGGEKPVACGDGWMRVGEFVAPMLGGKEQEGIICIDGKKIAGNYSQGIAAAEAPEFKLLRDRHLYDPADYPSADVILKRFNENDPSVAILTGFPDLDVKRAGWAAQKPGRSVDPNSPEVTQALQQLLDAYPLVLIPKGNFLLKDTITLHGDAHLMGVTGLLSELRPHPLWKVTKETPILKTDNLPDASPKLSWLKIGWGIEPIENDWFAPLHWQAGKGVVRKPFMRPYGSRKEANPKAEVRIFGHGGGRWYGAGLGPLIASKHPDHRRFLIEATTSPLAFYNLNIERGQGNHQMEIRGASNVAIYCVKHEFSKAMLIRDSQNVAMYGQSGNAETVVRDCKDLLIANTGNRTHNYDETSLRDEISDPPLVIKSPYEPAYIKHGQFDLSKMSTNGR